VECAIYAVDSLRGRSALRTTLVGAAAQGLPGAEVHLVAAPHRRA
jgi:hypothetical protein